MAKGKQKEKKDLVPEKVSKKKSSKKPKNKKK